MVDQNVVSVLTLTAALTCGFCVYLLIKDLKITKKRNGRIVR